MARIRIRHYVPQALLERFRGETLYQLDRQTGQIEARAVGRAGGEPEFYPDHIENGILQKLDNDGPRVLRYTVWRERYKLSEADSRFDLTEKQRRSLSEWLFFFAVRSPFNLHVCDHITDQWNADPRNALQTLDEDFEKVLGTLRQENPEGIAAAEQELGPEGLRTVLYVGMRDRILV